MVVRGRGPLLRRLRRFLAPPEEWPLSRERAFHLLSNRRRRRVIAHLATERETTFEALVDRIATEEREGDEDRRDAVYASLHQTHLPALVDAGVVERAADGTRVRITERGVWLHSYLAAGRHRSWGRAFLAGSSFWLTLSVAAVAGVPAARAVPSGVLLAGCLGTALGTALLQRRRLP
jgi:hypothetical protein